METDQDLKGIDAKMRILNWYNRTSLTTKTVILTLFIGLFLWAALEYVQSSKLKRIFYVKLFKQLNEQSIDDRIQVSRNIKTIGTLAELIVKQRNFSDYFRDQSWLYDESSQSRIKYYQRPPPWFLNSSLTRAFVRPRYTIIIDSGGKAREVYLRYRDDNVPPALLDPTKLLLMKSHGQSLVTRIDEQPYIVASKTLIMDGDSKVTLMMSTPMDEIFLNTSIMTRSTGHMLALLTSEEEPRILTSSNLAELPAGTPLSAIEDDFLITGQHEYDLGSAEYIIKLASLITMEEVNALTSSVISTGRYQRNIIAPVFIFSFAIIMYFLTRKINLLNKNISDFSIKTLGTEKYFKRKGDQLFLLENSFYQLTEEIIEGRERLKRQAEEKTRLIVENAFDAIITMDMEGSIITWNPQAETTFGWSSKDIIGHKITDTIMPQQYHEAFDKSMLHFLATGEGPILNRRIEITASHRDGREFPIELSVSSAMADSTNLFIAIIRDISERKKAEERIKASLKEKEVLLKEIHHRVKNNMQIISSLLNLQANNVNDKDYTAMLNESHNRIKSMSLVHEKLYQSEDLSSIDFYDYIKSLVNGLFEFYSINTNRISLSLDIQGTAIDVDTAIPCGLIINELVSNSLKHAFPDDRQGNIKISFHKNELDGATEYEMITSDDGVGMPESLDIRQTDTLGLQLVTTLVEIQLQSKIELSRGQDGTQFLIRFKKYKSKPRI
jgi:PAS domain S-box-containing protein